MVNLLRKIFIKNYNDVTSKTVRDSHGKLAAFVGIFSNLILFIIKIISGILSSSISIIADSINNLSDMGSSIITLVGFHLSSKPSDDEHPYGHERIEYICGLVVAIIILVVGFQLLLESINNIFNPQNVTYTTLSIIILLISIFIKLWQSYFNRKIGKAINSVVLQATATDSLNDVISTFVILLGAIVHITLSISVDAYLGCLVSLFIIYSGIKMVKEAVNPLIGVSPNSIFVKNILDYVKKYKDVIGMHDLVCHMYGPTKCFMTLHVEVDARKDIIYLHDIIDNIEHQVKKKFGVDLVIHMDPIDLENAELKTLKNKVGTVLKEIDPNLSFHDFRIVAGHTHQNILFDVVIPRNYRYTDKDLAKILKEKIKSDKNYNFIITTDFNYFINQEN